jgi:hopanoid biosynthesis associated radical SAM protein HpnH
MRFPFSLTRSLTSYLIGKRLRGDRRFPLVLMLEPLHACNLTCTGCGRIREYASTVKQRLTLEQCLASVDECGAPVVSICGGEPLAYAPIGELVAATIARHKHVYLCTNGVFLKRKLEKFRPSSRLFFNIHLDGMEETHDKLVERTGVFVAAVEGIKAAKRAGFQVCTNTTLYKNTNIDEVAVLLAFLTELKVDGMMISPAYGYDAVMKQSGDGGGDGLFMTRDEVHAWFRNAEHLLRRYKMTSTPIYQEFLRGQRVLDCAAWANPTRNIRGWKGPCYLITDAHYASYRELIEKTAWEQLGPGKDPRCEHCLMHCGFEPAAVLESNKHIRDGLKMALWQMGR